MIDVLIIVTLILTSILAVSGAMFWMLNIIDRTVVARGRS